MWLRCQQSPKSFGYRKLHCGLQHFETFSTKLLHMLSLQRLGARRNSLIQRVFHPQQGKAFVSEMLQWLGLGRPAGDKKHEARAHRRPADSSSLQQRWLVLPAQGSRGKTWSSRGYSCCIAWIFGSYSWANHGEPYRSHVFLSLVQLQDKTNRKQTRVGPDTAAQCSQCGSCGLSCKDPSSDSIWSSFLHLQCQSVQVTRQVDNASAFFTRTYTEPGQGKQLLTLEDQLRSRRPLHQHIKHLICSRIPMLKPEWIFCDEALQNTAAGSQIEPTRM